MGAGSPFPAGTAGPAGTAAVDPSWQGELSAWLQDRKSYPAPARERGEEGAVTLTIVVARDGRVLDVVLARKSGFETLDGAAMAMLRSARVPPFPAAMPQAQVTVMVALRYTLAR
jgi:protein TonB